MNMDRTDQLIQIAIALTGTQDISVLLDRILMEAMDITHCDGGTVYILENQQLVFHNMVTRSRGIHLIRDGRDMLLPPVPMTKTHVCACSALEHKLINIPDVYEAGDYNFTGTRNYDQMNHYRTQSMLVVPMEDEKQRTIGVLQLINAMDESGAVIPFSQTYEKLFLAMGSLAAVSLRNTLLQEAVLNIMHSFVGVMVDAIDARSPYNANHTRSMVRYAEKFLQWLDADDHGFRIAPEYHDAFLMSVWLHDIGKLIIPLHIMDKPTRLGAHRESLMYRIEVARLMERLKAYENVQTAEGIPTMTREELEKASALILQADDAPYLDDGQMAALQALCDKKVLDAQGQAIPLLDDYAREALHIRKGSLTEWERQEMERHVVYTRRLLSHMQFSDVYTAVPAWAGAHHELLNGTGYPDHLRDEQIPKEVRLLTILDIYDALTAEDRPYKPALSPQQAFRVLAGMRDEGKLDSEMLQLFYESRAWERDGDIQSGGKES